MTKKQLKDELYGRIKETDKRIDNLILKHNEVRDNVFEKLALIANHLGVKFGEEDYITEEYQANYLGIGIRKVVKQRLVLKKIKK